MKKTLTLFGILLLLACSTNSKQKKEKPFDLNTLVKINPHWVGFYQNRINDFHSSKFEITKSWTTDSWEAGNIKSDTDPDFDQIYKPFLIDSKDRIQYIDLDSYQKQLEMDENGKIVFVGSEPDQEVNWVNRETNEIKRISFVGSAAKIEDASWLDEERVILFGKTGNTVFLELIDLSLKKHTLFQYPDTIYKSDDYLKMVRMKAIRFE